MINDPLDDRIAGFYRGQFLSQVRLQQLQSLGEEHLAAERKQPWSNHLLLGRYVVAGGFAAAALILAIGLTVYWKDGARHSGSSSLLRAVASEIAMNHRKQLALEFSAADYRDLARRMEKLDFRLVAPADPEAAQLHLLGSRYCSIQGRLAAQLRLRDDTDRVHTLYETDASQKLRSAAVGEIKVANVRVRTWTDGDVFYGLAVADSGSK